MAFFFARLGYLIGSEIAQNFIVMGFTQVLSSGLGVFAGPNSQSSADYAAQESDCDQVAVMQQQTQQLQDFVRQAPDLGTAQASLGVRMRTLRSSMLVYAQSLSNERKHFRTRAAIAIILNIYITLMLVFMILHKTQRRHGTLSHAELDLSILEAARRDSALAATLQTSQMTPATPPTVS